MKTDIITKVSTIQFLTINLMINSFQKRLGQGNVQPNVRKIDIDILVIQ